MKAKRSAVLCLGLLLMTMLAVWSQTGDVGRAVCPPLEDEAMQSIMEPSAWVRADWNAKSKQWQIRCDEMDTEANMAVSVSYDMMNTNSANTMVGHPAGNRPAANRPAKRRPHE